MNEWSDEQLLAHVANGEVTAFKMLFDRYGGRVTGFCVKLLRDQALAEDACQETFWRIWNGAHTFDGQRGNFQSWLFGIARNLAIDTIRRQKNVLVESLPDGRTAHTERAAGVDAEPDVAEVAWVSIQQQQVQQALAELPPDQRDVIEWIYFQGMTRREIAQEKNIPFGTINTRAQLALEKLGRALRANGYGLEE
ncbi:MAG: sigma-70 family RNA polymerase sigma factor [Chloroflexi bacterium]|nr:sigma-70 family RNA polymerase sigma factor [Ardenticatenaceae bacterium]MBL1127424.1 sigma-70 family RNA polymerase sigma factor [Chloroflexota bacterium]NOG33487.1 sigma-70 family RNA polymerase sigma factor [Chloroflexota bacterium]